MAVAEQSILSRLDRLDAMLRHLEEIRGSGRSPRSSSPSTPSSGTRTSDGHASSVDFSPKSLEKHCRPIDRVMMETEVKGSLIERLNQVEGRVLKLEEEIEAEKKRTTEVGTGEKKHKKRGFKHLVKKVVKGGTEHRSTKDE